MSRVLNFIFVCYSSCDGMTVSWTHDSHTTEQLLVNGTPTPSNAAVLNTPITQDVRRQVVTSVTRVNSDNSYEVTQSTATSYFHSVMVKTKLSKMKKTVKAEK
jgi:hypothetical protein